MSQKEVFQGHLCQLQQAAPPELAKPGLTKPQAIVVLAVGLVFFLGVAAGCCSLNDSILPAVS